MPVVRVPVSLCLGKSFSVLSSWHSLLLLLLRIVFCGTSIAQVGLIAARRTGRHRGRVSAKEE